MADFYTISVQETVTGYVAFSVLRGLVCHDGSQLTREEEPCRDRRVRVKRVCGAGLCEKEYVEVSERETGNTLQTIREGVSIMCVSTEMLTLEASCEGCDRWSEGSSVEIAVMLEEEWMVLGTYRYDKTLFTPSVVCIPIPHPLEPTEYPSYRFDQTSVVDVMIQVKGVGSLYHNDIMVIQWNEEDPSWHRILFTVTDSSQMQVIAESVHCYLRVISTSVVMLLMRSWLIVSDSCHSNISRNYDSLIDQDSSTLYHSYMPMHSFLFTIPSNLHLAITAISLTRISSTPASLSLLLEGMNNQTSAGDRDNALNRSWSLFLNTSLTWPAHQLSKTLALPTIPLLSIYRITILADVQWSLAELSLSIVPSHLIESLYSSRIVVYQGYPILYESFCQDCYSFSVIPSLPSPLLLDSSTGLIFSDEPLITKSVTEHTITASSHSQGSLVAITTIEVKACLRPEWLLRLCLQIYGSYEEATVTLSDGQKEMQYSVRNSFQKKCHLLCLPQALYTLTSSHSLDLSLSTLSSITLFSSLDEDPTTHSFSLHDVVGPAIDISDLPWNHTRWKKSQFPVAEIPSGIGIFIRTSIHITNPQSVLRLFIQFTGGFILYLNDKLTAVMNLPTADAQESLTRHDYSHGESVDVPAGGCERMEVRVVCTRYHDQSESEYVQCDLRGMEIDPTMTHWMFHVLSSSVSLPSVQFSLLNKVPVPISGYVFTLSRIPVGFAWTLEGSCDGSHWELLHLQPPIHLSHPMVPSLFPALITGYHFFKLTSHNQQSFHSIQWLTVQLLTPSLVPPLCSDPLQQFPSVALHSVSACPCPTGFSGYMQRRCEAEGFGPIDRSLCHLLPPQQLHYKRSEYQFPCGIASQTDVPTVVNQATRFESMLELPAGLTITEAGQILGRAKCENVTELVVSVRASNEEGSCVTQIRVVLVQPRCAMTELCPDSSVGESCVYSCMKDHRGIGVIHGKCVIIGETANWVLSERCISMELVEWCVGVVGVGILLVWIGLRVRRQRMIEGIEREPRQFDGMIVAV